MKKTLLIFVFIIIAFPLITTAQSDYPFSAVKNDKDIKAYWYNVPEDSLKLMVYKDVIYFHPTMQIYGRAQGDNFKIRTKVFLKNGKKVYERTFDVKKEDESEKDFSVEYRGDFFKLKSRVKYLDELPDRIIVTLISPEGTQTKEINCRYHKLYGKITDFEGNPFKAFISIRPDGFSFANSIWTDKKGYYEIYLPQRTYNDITVVNRAYAVKVLEAWGWHIIHDKDQRLDFKVGTGEVYNLNVWANNGGGSTLFISFRPMVLDKSKNPNKYNVNIGGKKFDINDITYELKPEDITVKINGKESEIFSVQKYYETVTPDRGMVSYLLQVNRKGWTTPGKQTVVVEYDKEIEKNGKTIKCTSMGVFQFYTNFKGLSKYY